MLPNGLYEQIISKGLKKELEQSEQIAQTAVIDSAEAAKVLAKYIADIAEGQLQQVQDNGGDLNDQITLANRLLQAIAQNSADEENSSFVSDSASQLLALLDRQNNIQAFNGKNTLVRPETSIAQTSLFTGAVHEPQMYSELKKEIVSCDRIDMLVSFIKWSGLRLLMD